MCLRFFFLISGSQSGSKPKLYPVPLLTFVSSKSPILSILFNSKESQKKIPRSHYIWVLQLRVQFSTSELELPGEHLKVGAPKLVFPCSFWYSSMLVLLDGPGLCLLSLLGTFRNGIWLEDVCFSVLPVSMVTLTCPDKNKTVNLQGERTRQKLTHTAAHFSCLGSGTRSTERGDVHS